MPAAITIAFHRATATSSIVALVIEQGAMVIALNQASGIAFASGATNLVITSGRVAIATMPGAIFDGTLTVLIAPTAGETPTVSLDNVAPGATPPSVTWPTAQGPEQQILMSGNPIALAGLIEDD